ncbi:MAG: DUF488 family protein [Roseiflexaceae bacterium]
MSECTIYTIGHSNISLDEFCEHLQLHQITAIADVRSTPYSQFTPHFNREALQKSLQAMSITYVFLGEELGARTKDISCYNDEGQVIYSKLRQTALFQQGLQRIITGAKKFRLALVCAEKEPFTCHRSILIGQALQARNVDVRHILHDGRVETHEQMLQRLTDHFFKNRDMFDTEDAQRTRALQSIERQIAYVNPVLDKNYVENPS